MFRLLIQSTITNQLEEVAQFQFSDDAVYLFNYYSEQGTKAEVRGRGLFYSEEVLISNIATIGGE